MRNAAIRIPVWLSWCLPSIAAAIAGAAFLYGSVSNQFLSVAVFLSLLIWMLGRNVASIGERLDNQLALLSTLKAPVELAGHPRLYQRYSELVSQFRDISRKSDSLYHELAEERLYQVAEQMSQLAQGDITYSGTETWRMAYQKVLNSLDRKVYYSVAWMRSHDYWADTPGRQSMQLNFELIRRGFRIERVHILPEDLWENQNPTPSERILPFLRDQARNGIVTSIVREADILSEPDLLHDFAIYGDRATAIQELDEQSRTLRFILSFDKASLRRAFDRWERLSLFSAPFSLDPWQATTIE